MYGRRIQPGYTLLLFLTIVFTVGAIITLGYNAKAVTPNLLGYKGFSSLAPLTTLGLLACSFITCKVRVRFFKR
jgi:hypothetical protein